MHEDLLGYLLGALDADEQHRIEAELAKSPQLRQELARTAPVPGAAGVRVGRRGSSAWIGRSRVRVDRCATKHNLRPTPRSLSRMRTAAGVSAATLLGFRLHRLDARRPDRLYAALSRAGQ